MRTVVVSTNNNDKYLFFIPLICYAWNKIGWNVFCLMTQGSSEKRELAIHYARKYSYCKEKNIFYVPLFSRVGLDKEYREETLIQCSRLYAACTHFFEKADELLMISDIDMLPLSNYWNPSYDRITCYGKDLSDTHFPMCYISMMASQWRMIMEASGIIEFEMDEALKQYPQAKSNNKEQWWTVDQDLLTDKLSYYKDIITYIDRGQSPYSDYPVGRIDRSAWETSHKETLRIDAHLLRPGFTDENWPRIMKLIKECFNPTEQEVEWMENYKNEYVKLL